ncbi:MFS transporter [Shewanella sp. 10N.261.52.F9]|uniref:MFS transporter n=1 Tax=Shewanella TaxID=22 RepID=UPI00200E8761|nr:MFS transporter [Shewanella marinintestina]MCL1147267.1 MFS transporter [Shewanella marinintestina]
MSLISMPFVDSGVDTALHGVAAVVMVVTVAAAAFGFWKIHEMPINKAHKKQHQQIGLITALTWIGFVWHWVWVIAVMVAFVDGDKALRRIRDVWREKEPEIESSITQEEQNNA